MRLEKTTETTGRVLSRHDRPIGLWWKCGDGYAAKCGVLGDFSAPTLEALLSLVEASEALRLTGVANVVNRLREKRQAPEREALELRQEDEAASFIFLAAAIDASASCGPPLVNRYPCRLGCYAFFHGRNRARSRFSTRADCWTLIARL